MNGLINRLVHGFIAQHLGVRMSCDTETCIWEIPQQICCCSPPSCLFASFVGEEFATVSPSLTHFSKLTIHTPSVKRSRQALPERSLIPRKGGGIHYLGDKYASRLLTVISQCTHCEQHIRFLSQLEPATYHKFLLHKWSKSLPDEQGDCHEFHTSKLC